MFQPRNISILVLVILIIAVAWATAAGTSIDQKGVLAGKVLIGGLTTPGTDVREGDILVFVETITGPAAAARANLDGKVKEVLVKPDDVIKTGDVLVRIEPTGK